MSESRSARRSWVEGLTIVVVTLLIALIFVADVSTPANFVPPILYGVPVVAAAWSRRAWFVWAITGTVVILTFVAHLVQPVMGRDEPLVTTAVLTNRLLASLATLLTAGLVHLWTNARARRDEHEAYLAAQNEELERINRELAEREEEITRQNEELQAQTEELERQSEELRVTNEELDRREKMLERLLELSRGLTAETARLSRADIMGRICSIMTELAGADASAILVRDDGHMHVECDHGFGPEGVAETRLLVADSFASLIFSRGQPGYIEDVRQRPDLRIPAPAEGEGFRSVLAAPLHVGGRIQGTLEVYARVPRSWTSEHIAIIESLAAQASVSMDLAALFREIQNGRERFETVFRTMPFPVLVAEDAELRTVRGNPAAVSMVGVTTETNLATLVQSARRGQMAVFRDGQPVPARLQPLHQAVLDGRSLHNEEYEYVLPGGDRRMMLVSAAPITNDEGKVTGAVAAGVDISGIKRLQTELELRRREAEEASVRKTRFLAAISHDIRTPVNAITLTAELIRRAAATPAMAGEIAGMAAELRSNASALNVLVHDLLDVARFDTGKMAFQETEFSLGVLVEEESRQLLPLAQEKGLKLRAEEQTAGVWLRADRVKLGRVLANLVSNAIKFTNEGEVVVSTAVRGDGVVIEVRDTGIGIDPQHMQVIFDEFMQLRNPERDRYKGTGLGLAICKRLIEAMGGTISVSSVPGKGSTFAVVLPRSSVVTRAEPPAPAGYGSGGGRPLLEGMVVVLVEDHATTRWATSQILRAEGAVVHEAPDGQTGLRLLESTEPQVVLLDMMLPDMDGREVLSWLRTNRKASLRGVLVLTGDLTSERAALVKELGATALVGKPIDMDQLLTTLRGIAGQAEAGAGA